MTKKNQKALRDVDTKVFDFFNDYIITVMQLTIKKAKILFLWKKYAYKNWFSNNNL